MKKIISVVLSILIFSICLTACNISKDKENVVNSSISGSQSSIANLEETTQAQLKESIEVTTKENEDSSTKIPKNLNYKMAKIYDFKQNIESEETEFKRWLSFAIEMPDKYTTINSLNIYNGEDYLIKKTKKEYYSGCVCHKSETAERGDELNLTTVDKALYTIVIKTNLDFQLNDLSFKAEIEYDNNQDKPEYREVELKINNDIDDITTQQEIISPNTLFKYNGIYNVNGDISGVSFSDVDNYECATTKIFKLRSDDKCIECSKDSVTAVDKTDLNNFKFLDNYNLYYEFENLKDSICVYSGLTSNKFKSRDFPENIISSAHNVRLRIKSSENKTMILL